MIPNVFVSSTVADLHYLRDAVRDVVSGLGYNPVMSEYGDIGYMASIPVTQACYNAMKDCQLAILIIGKKYGSKESNGISVTQN